MTRPALAAAALLLAACDLPLDSGLPEAPGFWLASRQVRLTARIGDSSPVVEVAVRRSNARAGLWVTTPPGGLAGGLVTWTSDSEGVLSVYGKEPALASEGFHATSLRLAGYLGSVEGPPAWTADLQVTYQVLPAPPATLTVEPARVTFEQWLGGPAPADQSFTLDGSAEGGPWSLALDFHGAAPWFEASALGGETLPATVTLHAIGPVARTGTALPTLTFRRGTAVATRSVEVTFRQPLVHLPAEPLVFTVVSRHPVLPSPVEVPSGTDLDIPISWTPTFSCSNWQGWLSATGPSGGAVESPGPLSIGVTSSNLPAGRHVCFVIPPWSATALQVILDVLPAVLSVQAPYYTLWVGPGRTPETAVSWVRLSASGGPATFAASVDVPWLELSTTTGTLLDGETLEIVVRPVPAVLEGMPRGYYVAKVSITGIEPDGTPILTEVEVSLSLSLPEVVAVAPAVELVGPSREVYLRAIEAGAPIEVSFGGIPAPAAARAASDGGLRVQPPALPPGDYRVSLATTMGFSLGQVTYRVAEPAPLAPGAVASAGRKVRLWYDDERGRLFAVNAGRGALERLDAGAAWATTTLEVPGLQDAALTPDGRRLLLAVAGAPLGLVDAATLAPLGGAPGPAVLDAGVAWRLVLAPDGGALAYRALAGGCGAAPCLDVQVDPASGGTSLQRHGLEGSAAGVSRARGRTVFLTRANPRELTTWAGGSWPPYHESPPLITPVDADALALDRHGDRVLFVRDGTSGAGSSGLADAAFAPLPGALPPTIAAALLTQDGNRAIAFDGAARTVRVFDLGVPPDLATGLFVEVGAPGGFDPGGEPGAGVVLALSADDRTLFLAGDERILVAALP